MSELVKLYTGPPMGTAYAFSLIFVVQFACFTFSSGIPMLYALGSLNFFVMYWVYKFFLLKWYCKSSEFNQEFIG